MAKNIILVGSSPKKDVNPKKQIVTSPKGDIKPRTSSAPVPWEITYDKIEYGYIKFYNKEKGFGFIQIYGQDVFFHISNVYIDEELIETQLEDKQNIDVRCKVIAGKKGPEAVEIYKVGYRASNGTTLLCERDNRIKFFFDADSERVGVHTFCGGRACALKNGKVVREKKVTTDDVVTLFEAGDIDSLEHMYGDFHGIKTARTVDGSEFKFYLDSHQCDLIAAWKEIELSGCECRDIIECRRELILDETRRTGKLQISMLYREEICSTSEYYSILKMQGTMYHEEGITYELRRDDEEYEITLENGIADVLAILMGTDFKNEQKL